MRRLPAGSNRLNSLSCLIPLALVVAMGVTSAARGQEESPPQKEPLEATTSEPAAKVDPLTSIRTTESPPAATWPTNTDGRRPDAGMLRYPDVSAEQIVFVYANDLWVAPRQGGMAQPLTSPTGGEAFPKFSQDGKTIAFMGNYDGNQDLYTIPVEGGIPQRVTYHPAAETLCDWTDNGQKLLYYSNAYAPMARITQLLVAPVSGAAPSHCPVPYGANGAISPDGKWLAYTPHTIDFRTWKRYRGGMATDIWLFNLQDKTSKRITDFEGTDTLPMWHGDKLYYLCDAGPEHRLNIWLYDPATGGREQISTFGEHDVKWPSIGPGKDGQGEIVLQLGPELAVLNLATRQHELLDVRVPGDRPAMRPRTVDAAKLISSVGISSTGKRAVVEARGDIWTLPAGRGSPRNLTLTAGTAERDPAWSPDGKWIAYFSDASSEYELYLTQSDGLGETKQLTKDSQTYYYSPTWSPNGKHIAYTDKAGSIYVHTLEGGKTQKLDTDPLANQQRLGWSVNSEWLAYTKNGENRNTAICLAEVKTGATHQVTSGMFNDTWPTFDRGGKYLFFASNRQFNSPIYEDVGTSFIYANTDILLAVPLREGIPNPGAPTSDEESFPGKKSLSSPAASKAYIDLVGFERRAYALPIRQGAFSSLTSINANTLAYVRGAPRGGQGQPEVQILNVSDGKEQTVIGGVGGFEVSSNGQKLIAQRGDTIGIFNPAAGQNLSAVPTGGMIAALDPREEWRQLFTEAWRIQRDFFYDPNMHGVDWPAVRDRYSAMLEDCAVRNDVSFVIGEMISELNVGHAYVRSDGDAESAATVPAGLLGCDFELHDGAYRIKKIIEGAAWDFDARGPLSQPGVDVKVGDYLLAVNGAPVNAALDPCAALQGLAGKTTTLTVSQSPKRDDKARDVLVTPLANEGTLRYRAWIEENRARVDKETGGKVGYIHVPDTGINGQNELVRQFFGQRHKPALVIDERWNGGGQIPTRFIELLNRPVTNYWARRDGRDWRWPPDSHQGPKAMLINGLAGSGGDAFPAYFRQSGLGKLIGTRTWGGLVGISGNPTLIDGAQVSAPTFAFYEKDGTWGIEGHGVDPDIEVVADPAQMQDGADPQLAAAISHLLTELEHNGYHDPPRPAYPNRSGFGIEEKDK